MRSACLFLCIFSMLYFATVVVLRIIRTRKRIVLDSITSVDYTTVLKGLAIIAVIFGHSGNYFGIRYLTPLGGIGVAVFLILSGYGINQSWKKNGHTGFWRKRLISFYIPYLFVELCGSFFTGGGYNSPWDCALDLLGLRPHYVYGWYITFLMFWYVLYYVCKRLFWNKTIVIYIIFCVVGVLIFVFFSSLYARQAVSFLIGVIMSDYEDRITHSMKNYGRVFFISGITGSRYKTDS